MCTDRQTDANTHSSLLRNIPKNQCYSIQVITVSFLKQLCKYFLQDLLWTTCTEI